MAKILVVEDDALVRENIVMVLNSARHTVLEASDGCKAMKMLDLESIDVVLTDIMMPEIDGIALILWIRVRHPGLRVIAISGGDRTGKMNYLDMAQKLGAHIGNYLCEVVDVPTNMLRRNSPAWRRGRPAVACAWSSGSAPHRGAAKGPGRAKSQIGRGRVRARNRDRDA